MVVETEIEVKKETLLEVKQGHSNNTHRRIQRGGISEYTSGKAEGIVVFDDRNLRGGFAQVPNVILYDPLMSSNEKVCYAILISYAWQKDQCFPSQTLLAENIGCTKRTVITTLAKLKKRRLIDIERPGQGRPNVYHIRKLSDGYLPRGIIDRGKCF